MSSAVNLLASRYSSTYPGGEPEESDHTDSYVENSFFAIRQWRKNGSRQCAEPGSAAALPLLISGETFLY